MRFRLVKITKNVERYPECAQDTEEFPHLVDRVSDEMDSFVVMVGKETEKFWPAGEFFLMDVGWAIREFEVKTMV